MRSRFALLLEIAVLLAACARPDAGLDPNSCVASDAARQYLHDMREKLFEVWQPPPESRRGEHSVVLVFWLDAAGYAEHVYTEQPDDPIAASAVAAFERAAPFGPVPAEAICLTEEHFRAEFTFEVRARR